MPRSAFPVLDLAQAREMDRIMVEDLGIPLERMMENAGRAVAEVARARLGGSVAKRRTVVYAGRGGNGGGSLVAARHLANAGASVAIITATSPDQLAPTTRSQLEIAHAMGIPSAQEPPSANRSELVIDGLHGYNLRGAPEEETARLITYMDSSPVVAVDIPSGLDVSSGSLREPHVRAAATVAVAAPKAGTFDERNRSAVGEVYVADISVPQLVFERLRLVIDPLVFEHASVVRIAPETS